MNKLTPLKVSILYRTLFFAIMMIALQSFTHSTHPKSITHAFIIGSDYDLISKRQIIQSKKHKGLKARYNVLIIQNQLV